MMIVKLGFLASAVALWLSPMALATNGQARRPSAATEAYFLYKTRPAEPRYGLAKVKTLIARYKSEPDFPAEVPPGELHKLTPDEMFTYCMVNPEDWSQNCSGPYREPGEEHMIRGSTTPLLTQFGEFVFFSWRQRYFLKQNRARVVALLQDTVREQRHAGPNILATIRLLNATELIPDLVDAFRSDARDMDVLSELAELMDVARYKPFAVTHIAKVFYGPMSNRRYDVPASKENIDTILRLATDFYNFSQANPASRLR